MARSALAGRSASAIWPLASTVPLLAFCALDVALQPDGYEGVWAVAILAPCVGALNGVLWGALLAVSGRLPRRVRSALWLAAACVLSVLLAESLSGFRRLGGRYTLHAIAVLAASFGGSVLLAAVALGITRGRRGQAPGFLLRARPRVQARAALVLLAISASVYVVDQSVYAQLYPQAHLALRLLGWWLGMFGLALAARGAALPRWSWLVWAGAVALGLALSVRGSAVQWVEMFGTRPWPALVLDAARTFTDVDRDGYSALFGGGDCRPWDPEVHPGAREIPGNGIDDNCLLGDASAADAGLEQVPQASKPAPGEPVPMDVVLITVDSLRPDHMGVYSRKYRAGKRATTPNIDAFARGAVVFKRAYTPGGGTNIAIGSLLRGLFPRRLQWQAYYETDHFRIVRSRQDVPRGQRVTTMFPLAFQDPRPPLPLLLQQRGMQTIAVLDDGYSEMLSRGTGIELGFESFNETDWRPRTERDDAGTANVVIQRLRFARSDRRLFIWAHFFGPHSPNTAHPGARVYGDSLADGYDHEINYLDMQIGRVLEALRESKRKAAVFITADHGDVMANGRYHGYTIADDVARVPLIARVPGWPARRIGVPVNLVDLVPTILELTRTPVPPHLDGVPLSAFVHAPEPKSNRVLFSDTWLYSAEGEPRVDQASAYHASGKIVLDRLTQRRYQEYGRGANQLLEETTRLERALDGYLEETGGAIQLR